MYKSFVVIHYICMHVQIDVKFRVIDKEMIKFEQIYESSMFQWYYIIIVDDA